MNLKDAVSSPTCMRFTMFLSRHLSLGMANRIAWSTASLVCRFKPAVYHTLRANLRQALGPHTEEKALQQIARSVFYTTARSYYDLYRAMQWPREELVASVDLTESAREVTRAMWDKEHGTIVVLPHLGNFDLGAQALVTHVPEMQVLSLPNPPAGFQFANEMRRRAGFAVTPVSSAALRQGIRLLGRGGMLAIAGDRPVSDLDEPVPFFGRPARVPSGHVRLALRTGADLLMGYSYLSPETQRHTLHLGPPLELIRTGDRDEEIRLNMRLVLDKLETIIRRWPGQWQMFVPVWPELVEA